MSAAPEKIGPPGVTWPATLRSEIEIAPPPRRAWYLTVGPAYLTIVTWGPFLDPLWRHDITAAGIPWLAGRAVLAVLLCFAMDYLPGALVGFRTGRRLGVIAASTFGTAGSEWLTGPILAAAEVVWYAVAIDFAVQSTLLGLSTGGLVPAGVLANWPVGPALLRNPVFLATALFWIFVTGMAALLRLTGIIAALMKVYAPVVLALLTIAALWLLPGALALGGGEKVAAQGMHPYPPRLSAIPIATGFFAILGLTSVEWGAACARRRDVVVGGLAGIVLGGGWSALMSLIVVAGAVGRLRAARPLEAATAGPTPVLSFRWAVAEGIGGGPAAFILILIGLAALAPAIFAASVFVRKLFGRWPRVRRIGWTWIGGTAALALIATGWPGRLEAVDHVMGILFAPAVGAMAGDWAASRGRWVGVRPGVNPAGVVAWGIGLAGRLVLDAMAERGSLPLPMLTASPVAGFVLSALAYAIMARLGMERPVVPVETSPGVG